MNKDLKTSVLVVDDNKLHVDALYDHLSFCGYEVIKATDPKRAVELSHSIRPDVILADIRMPKLDGIGLIRKFKAVQPQVKVILMTGYYSEYEPAITEALKSGLVDKVIQKRYRAIELERMLQEVLKTPSEDMVSTENAKPKVLFVDDEVEVLEFLRDFFSEKGCAVFTAEKAVEALEVYDTFQPEVVVTDINMPGKGGFWLIDELRKKKRQIKIIVITGQDNQEMIERFKELGIKEYFSKPLHVADLEHIAQKVFEASPDNGNAAT